MNLLNALKNTAVDFKIEQGQDLAPNVAIDDIAIDSRIVEDSAGSVFFALQGHESNGEEFVVSAIKNGAKIIVAKNYQKVADDVIFITSDQPFAILTKFLAQFFAPLPQNIFAVTGTNGKTSVVEFTRQVFDLLDVKAASIGTLGLRCDHIKGNGIVSSSLTTPDIVGLYKNLATLKKNNVDHVAIEASSIGLDQQRMAGLEIKNVAFTNFSQDHLDYHADMDDYFAAKLKLFTQLAAKNSNAIINADIDQFEQLKKACLDNNHNFIDYGLDGQGLQIVSFSEKDSGQEVVIKYCQEEYKFFIDINVNFQVFNLICALGFIFANQNLNSQQITSLLQKFDQLQSPTGRMQKVANYNEAEIFIDYAHTPDALEISLKNARKLKPKRLLVLFGCGGDRDHMKRPQMCQAACQNADYIIVTDDNPRNEDPAKIRQEIMASCDLEKSVEIDGRKNAIEKSLQMLTKGDIIILAGKGHEKYQSVKGQKIDFDEEKIVNEFIANN